MAKNRNPILQVFDGLQMMMLKSEYGVSGIGTLFVMLRKLSENKGMLPFAAIPAIADECGVDHSYAKAIVQDFELFAYNETHFWYPPICPKQPKATGQAAEDFSQYEEKQVVSFQKFTAFVAEHYPRVASMQQPFTIGQYIKLAARHNRAAITRVLAAMENKKDLHSKYVSAYLTANNWLSREINPADEKIRAAVRSHQ